MQGRFSSKASVRGSAPRSVPQFVTPLFYTSSFYVSFLAFIVADTQLFKRLCPLSVGPSVCRESIESKSGKMSVSDVFLGMCVGGRHAPAHPSATIL